MKKIPLRGKYGKGKFALVDNDVFEWASKDKWYLHKKGNNFYPSRWKNLDLHRLISDAQTRDIVDHINRNTLDCRRANLRLTDAKGNTRNVGIRKDNTSNYKGVNYWITKKKWMARIQVNNKRIFLGYFKTAKMAARAYNLASVKYHQDFAYLNNLTK